MDGRSKLIEAVGLTKTFPVNGEKKALLHAVSQVDLHIYEGETLALVGESGCGKSSLGRLILGLLSPTAGTVRFDGRDISRLSPRDMNRLRRDMQIVFQDTAAAINPRLDVAGILSEPLKIHRICPRGKEMAERNIQLLEWVGLSGDYLPCCLHELSGGQRQRVGIARALALDPRFLVCDEPVSSLDVSVQAQILNLLIDLQRKRGLTYLFISHDLGVVRQIADRVCIMFLGQICEVGPMKDIFIEPRHPYTRFLLNAVPRPDPTRRDETATILTGEPPSPVEPPSGCRFRTRCPNARSLCAQIPPPLTGAGEHTAACHFPLKGVQL